MAKSLPQISDAEWDVMKVVWDHGPLTAGEVVRHLAAERQSFSAIVNATRGALAERYLANDRYSLTDVSQLLGFAAPSTFSRWFRCRFGVTPSQWRDRARSRTPA